MGARGRSGSNPPEAPTGSDGTRAISFAGATAPLATVGPFAFRGSDAPRPAVLSLHRMVASNVSVPATAPTGGTVDAIAKSTVQVGQVFGQGGTDGLILYALILATFLMFLALIMVLILAFRAIGKRDTQFAEQSSEFAEASKETATALSSLAAAIAAKDAGDQVFRAGNTATLARVEGELARRDAARAGG